MLLAEIAALLACEVHTGDLPAGASIRYGCASDLLSDVLAFSRSGAVLMTGLVSVQTVHTAYVADIGAVILVRGKRPTPEIVALATEKKIPLLSTPYSMYESCGILYSHGLVSTMEPATQRNTDQHV